MNVPNQLTVARLILTFVFVALLSLEGVPFAKTGALLVFSLAAITDFLDGYLARKNNLVTNFGKLMDPLADKVLMCAGFVLLTRLELIPAWMVVVIVGRELAVTGLRGIASSEGHIVAASGTGKIKTLTQNVAIGALLFHHTTLGLPADTIGLTLLTFATALTLWSGYLYFADYFGWRTARA